MEWCCIATSWSWSTNSRDEITALVFPCPGADPGLTRYGTVANFLADNESAKTPSQSSFPCGSCHHFDRHRGDSGSGRLFDWLRNVVFSILSDSHIFFILDGWKEECFFHGGS